MIIEQKKLITDFLKEQFKDQKDIQLFDVINFKVKDYDDIFGLKGEHIIIEAKFENHKKIINLLNPSPPSKIETRKFLISRLQFVQWSYKKINSSTIWLEINDK